MARIGWKSKAEIDAEKQKAEEVRQKALARRERIKEGIVNANSVAALRELVKDMAMELGMIEES